MSGGLLSGTHNPAGVPGRNLAGRERFVTPQGPLPKDARNAPSRVPKTTYPVTSGMGALEQATGGTIAADRPMMRAEDVATVRRIVKNSKPVRNVAELVSDPTGLINLTHAVNAVRKHPGVGTGVGAGVSAAGFLLPGLRGARIEEEAPILSAARQLKVKLNPSEQKALQVVHEGVPIGKRIEDQQAVVKAATSKRDVNAAKKELSALRAASKHVHDVEVPGNETVVPGTSKTVAPSVRLPEGSLLHGSPEGELGNIDALYHTKAWREGPGFYATTSPEKAAKYAAGRTATKDRVTGAGSINVVKLHPGAKVLDMDAQPESFWRDIASKIIGEPIDEARWKEWARDIRPEDEKGASVGVLNRVRLLHLLTGYDEMPKTDAYYAIEEALHGAGYQATKHTENGVPVYIIKDASAIERVGSHKPEDLLPKTVTTEPRTIVGRSSYVPRIVPSKHALVDTYQRAHAIVQKQNLPKEARQQLVGALSGARSVRGRQEAGYSVERKARFAQASKHLNDSSLDPAERLGLAKAQLKGELPKIDFQGLKVLDEPALKTLQTHILDHPYLMPGQKIRAADSLTNALAGKVPTKSELTLLEHVFGKETANSIGGVALHPYRDLILSALNVPRSLMASFDLSAPFRQGLVVGTRHPAIFARNFKPMVKAFGSENVYHAIHEEIHARPTYPMMLEAKLAITELTKSVGSREERFASDIAEHIPVVGHGIRASGRAYTGFLDKTRADVFDHLVQQAASQGINVQDEKFLKGLGSYINSATGRGDLGHFHEAGKVLNTFFFSPRLLASRLNFMNPLYYSRLDPFARKEAIRSAIQLAGTLSTLLALASRIPGVQVVTDPRNPDWGKIKKGNTRIDIAGGFQQPLRLFAQLASGTAISSTTGKKLNLTANGFGQPTRLDLLMRFFEGKEAPWASFVTDKLRNSDQVGNKFRWSNEVYQRMIPLLAQDTYDLYNSKHGGMNGLEAAFGGYALGSVGFGLQTYGPKPAKTSGSSSSPFSSPGLISDGGSGSSSGGGLLSSGG